MLPYNKEKRVELLLSSCCARAGAKVVQCASVTLLLSLRENDQRDWGKKRDSCQPVFPM